MRTTFRIVLCVALLALAVTMAAFTVADLTRRRPAPEERLRLGAWQGSVAVFDRGEKINTRMRDLLDAFDRAPADDRKETDPALLAAQRKRAEDYLNRVLSLAEKRQT